jgi:hypothetical protein
MALTASLAQGQAAKIPEPGTTKIILMDFPVTRMSLLTANLEENKEGLLANSGLDA